MFISIPVLIFITFCISSIFDSVSSENEEVYYDEYNVMDEYKI